MANTRSIEDPPQAGAHELAELVGSVREAERHLARAVALAGRLAASGVSERVEGLPLDLLLGPQTRMTGPDRRMLITAGEVLTDLPTVAALFTDGALSWGQVRAITYAARRLPAVVRAQLDARIAATVTARDGVDAYDPDELLWAVDAAAEELRGARSVEQAERRSADASFVAVQSSLDGGARLYADLDALTAAPVLNALDTAADRPQADTDATGEQSGSTRGRQDATALRRICADWLGGDTNRPARPLLIAHVDLSQTAVTPHGTVELAVRGGLPRITAAALECLATDAELRTVLFDGARPLAVSRRVDAATITSAPGSRCAPGTAAAASPAPPTPSATATSTT